MNIKAFHINQVSHNLLNIREYFDKWKLLSKVVSFHAQPKFFWQNIHLCPDQSWHWNSQLFYVQPQTKQKLHFLKIISRATYNIFLYWPELKPLNIYFYKVEELIPSHDVMGLDNWVCREASCGLELASRSSCARHERNSHHFYNRGGHTFCLRDPGTILPTHPSYGLRTRSPRPVTPPSAVPPSGNLNQCPFCWTSFTRSNIEGHVCRYKDRQNL